MVSQFVFTINYGLPVKVLAINNLIDKSKKMNSNCLANY